MTDKKIGLDFRYRPDQPIESTLRSLADGVGFLYWKAAETWPSSQTRPWPTYSFEDGVFKVDLTMPPAISTV